MMTVEISQLLTVLGAAGSTALTLWAHGREFKKEKKATLDSYAATQIKAEGHRRDIEHLKRDFAQLSANVTHLDDEIEKRLRELESGISHIRGEIATYSTLRGNP